MNFISIKMTQTNLNYSSNCWNTGMNTLYSDFSQCFPTPSIYCHWLHFSWSKHDIGSSHGERGSELTVVGLFRLTTVAHHVARPLNMLHADILFQQDTLLAHGTAVGITTLVRQQGPWHQINRGNRHQLSEARSEHELGRGQRSSTRIHWMTGERSRRPLTFNNRSPFEQR